MRRNDIGDNCIDDMFYLRDSLIWKIEYEKLKLQERIDKAIEYINSFDYYIPEDDKPKLLDILKGSDSNENE